ncbi:AdoMet_MTases domain containing protein [Burkholderiaceae bacterium]
MPNNPDTFKPDPYHYPGLELELFGRATNWRKYWSSKVKPYLSGEILEVGAGIGSAVHILHHATYKKWVCLEPDPLLVSAISADILSGKLSANIDVQVGDLSNLNVADRFNSILYIDVLEHIKDDRNQLCEAYAHLLPGGYLVILSPAHPFLYSSFDKAIGHYRRYNKAMLSQIQPTGSRLIEACYLDSFGLFANFGNKIILHSETPTPFQIIFWDTILIRLSSFFDRLLRWKLGKTILFVLQKPLEN